jgi:hypothetical protein
MLVLVVVVVVAGVITSTNLEPRSLVGMAAARTCMSYCVSHSVYTIQRKCKVHTTGEGLPLAALAMEGVFVVVVEEARREGGNSLSKRLVSGASKHREEWSRRVTQGGGSVYTRLSRCTLLENNRQPAQPRTMEVWNLYPSLLWR